MVERVSLYFLQLQQNVIKNFELKNIYLPLVLKYLLRVIFYNMKEKKMRSRTYIKIITMTTKCRILNQHKTYKKLNNI